MRVSLGSGGRRLRTAARALRGTARRKAGGERRLRAVLLLASVVSLDGADKGTLSVNAGALEHAFGVGHTALGLLASVASLTGAAFTLPVGALTDRMVRVRLLGGSIVLWAFATVLSGLAPSYLWLVSTRALLGAVTATSGPTVASLVGDYFPLRRRARLYGYVLVGEFVGSGIGLVVTSVVSAVLSWRYAVAWPAVPALALAWFAWHAPEPRRGGQSNRRPAAAEPAEPAGEREAPGQSEVPSKPKAPAEPESPAGSEAPPAEPEARARPEPPSGPETPARSGPSGGPPHAEDAAPGGGRREDAVRRAVDASGAEVHSGAVLREDPATMPWRRAVMYVLRIRTVLIMIVASTLGYFFLAGVRTFAVLFATRQYGISRGSAGALILLVGAGGLVGLVAGGRVADRLLAAGRADARVLVPVVSLLTCPLALAPAIVVPAPGVAIPLLVLGTGVLAATNPPLDAARLDVVPPGLWGRAESVRTAARTLGEFAAPLLFGYLSSHVFTSHGLRWTFLVCLAPLAAAGLLGLLALRTYPADVATATASAESQPAARPDP